MGSHWSAAAVASIADEAYQVAPPITAADLAPVFPGLDLWDMWPVQTRGGDVAGQPRMGGIGGAVG